MTKSTKASVLVAKKTLDGESTEANKIAYKTRRRKPRKQSLWLKRRSVISCMKMDSAEDI